MRIWWGFRFGFDCAWLFLCFEYFSMYPAMLYRGARSDPVRWGNRRRTYSCNPYFSDEATWKLKYDRYYNPVP